MRSIALAAAVLLGSTSGAQAAYVAATNAQPSIIAQLYAGTSYTISITGVADLNRTYNDGLGLPFYADGASTYTFPGILSVFAERSLVDPTSGRHAQAYNFSFGALVGSLTANPEQAEFFALRDGSTVQFTTDVTLYGLVNDSAYGDNAGGYYVDISSTTQLAASSSVPEPATWVMMMLGFGVIGASLRRKPDVRKPNVFG